MGTVAKSMVAAAVKRTGGSIPSGGFSGSDWSTLMSRKAEFSRGAHPGMVPPKPPKRGPASAGMRGLSSTQYPNSGVMSGGQIDPATLSTSRPKPVFNPKGQAFNMPSPNRAPSERAVRNAGLRTNRSLVEQSVSARPKIKMPGAPVSGGTAPANPVASTGSPLGWGEALGGIGLGAALGGGASWATGGSFWQGAAAGGMVGGGAAGGLHYRSKLAGMGESAIGVAGGEGSKYSGKMVEFASQFDSKEARRAAIVGGAALGGFAFGGNKSHKRGFNAHRGNSIGR